MKFWAAREAEDVRKPVPEKIDARLATCEQPLLRMSDDPGRYEACPGGQLTPGSDIVGDFPPRKAGGDAASGRDRSHDLAVERFLKDPIAI